MKKALKHFIAYFFKLALWFRYRITVKGLERLNECALPRTGGTLFLPNHPAMFVDPIIVMVILALSPKFHVRPLTIEEMYEMPVANIILRSVDALPLPRAANANIAELKKRNMEVIRRLTDALNHHDDFLMYPAGKLKHTNKEVIGNVSGVYHILQGAPDANIVLVRTKGLWGSSFSRAQTHALPPMIPTILKGIWISVKNLIFFNPRRDVIVEFELAPEDFPRNGTKIEMNKWLEDWYNRPDGLTPQEGEHPGESLILVPYSIWKVLLDKLRFGS